MRVKFGSNRMVQPTTHLCVTLDLLRQKLGGRLISRQLATKKLGFNTFGPFSVRLKKSYMRTKLYANVGILPCQMSNYEATAL